MRGYRHDLRFELGVRNSLNVANVCIRASAAFVMGQRAL
jgi:hypothetical protein